MRRSSIPISSFAGRNTRTPNRRIWTTACAVLIVAAAACDKLGMRDASPTAPSGPLPPGSTVNYTAVGASDATGHGASVECVPLTDCPQGTGYVPVTARELRARGFTVTLLNLGIPTAVIGRDFQSLGRQYNHTIVGNFIDDEMPFVRNSTLVTVFAGGNEVNVITSALGNGAGGSDPAGYIDSQVRAFGSDYATLISGIRDRAAAGVHIIVLNVPNFGALPYLARASTSQRQAAQRAAVGMTTTAVNPLAGAQNVSVVDIMCDARTYQSSNYSSDGFHPNDSGYAFIAAEIVNAATASSYPAPRSTCPQMTAIP